MTAAVAIIYPVLALGAGPSGAPPSCYVARVDDLKAHNDANVVLPPRIGHLASVSSVRSRVEFEHNTAHVEATPSNVNVTSAPAKPSYPITPHLQVATPGGRRNGTYDMPYPEDSTGPPVPPKTRIHPIHCRAKSVSIVAPTDISPARRVFSHSGSDTGHSYRASSYFPAGSSDSAPGAPNLLTSQQSAAHISVSGSLPFPFSSGPITGGPSRMDPVNRQPSSMPAQRNVLHKPRPYPSTTAPTAGPSGLGLFLSRTFGSGESSSRHHRRSVRSTTTSMSDRFYRPTRSLSDGSTKGSLTRPSPSSRSSDMTDSSYTASSSASTSFSYPSTTLTTPDSTSPGLSPRNSTRANKLHKKRPSMAPSAYQYPLGRHAAALGRSKSTPNGVGQRPPRHRIWTSVEEARHVAEVAQDALGESELSLWCSSPTDSSPVRRSNLGPIREVHKRTSSQALSDLACTGLCSTSVAAQSSQLALSAQHPAQGSGSYQDHVWDGVHAAHFDPYAECPSQDTHTHDVSGSRSSQPFPTSHSPHSASRSDSLNNVDSAPSGFAVVNGYLDRSEDAMRRWTLAMADVPDEVLVHHLERLRKESAALARGRLPGRRSAAPSQIGHNDDEYTIQDRRSSFFFGGPREMGISPRSPSRGAQFSVGHHDDDGDDSDEEVLSEEDDDNDWKTARQVLFCCRELVQTERNYQARLRDLASTELSSHYAALVARYVPALLRVSENMLAHLLDDPSAWGVSAAFIGCEEELESALVAWSGVAGEFFLEDANLRPPRKLTKKFTDEMHSNLGHDISTTSIARVFRTRSQVGIAPPNRGSRRFSSTMSDVGHGGTSSVGHSTGMFTAALGTGLGFGLSVPGSQSPLESGGPVSAKSAKLSSTPGVGRVPTTSSGLGLSRAVNAWKRRSMPSSLSHLPGLTVMSPPDSTASPSQNGMRGQGHSHTSSAHGHTPSKKPSERDMKMSARDLAIQPTQRVMRYVLQYRDLLDHTPTTSPSRALVERAYDSALRIAKRCDRAQVHAAFFRQSTGGTKTGKHSLRPSTTT